MKLYVVVRNTDNKLISKQGSRGKFWMVKAYADDRAKSLNRYQEPIKYVVKTLEFTMDDLV